VLNQIETADGMPLALTDGLIHKLIQPHADKTTAEIKTRKRPITGVSEFALIGEPPVDNPNAKPSPSQVSGAITIEALTPTRLAEPYEALRNRSDAYLKQHGQRPQLFLCNVGSVGQWKPRAGFTQNLAWAGGIDAIGAEQGYANADEAANAFVASGAKLAAICSHDDVYPELIPQLAKALVAKGAALIVVAGKPGEQEASYRAAGVGLFIHMGCDVVAALDALLAKVGC
jgi:methylmalonyl-CoA mutase